MYHYYPILYTGHIFILVPGDITILSFYIPTPSLFPFSIPKKFLFYILTSECPLLNEGWGEKRGCVFNPITHFLYMYLLFLTKKFLGYFLISHLKPPLSVPPLYTKICPYNPMPLVAPLLSPPTPMPPLTFTLFNIEVPSN